MTGRFLAYVLLAGSSFGALPATSQEAGRSTREAILESARHPWLKWPAFPDRVDDMKALYAAESDGVVWFEDEAVHPATASAVETLVRAEERGLSPEDYDAPLLAARLQELRLGEGLLDGRILFDLGLSLGLVERGRLRVRQRPGAQNALGRVVFSFPNQENIYMHDTPARQLFARSRRDFSHGCIRIEDPLGLARWILRDQPAWTEERMQEAIDLSKPTWVGLTKPLPVVIFYATAFVDRMGRARFFEDIYGHDARLREALAKGYPYPR